MGSRSMLAMMLGWSCLILLGCGGDGKPETIPASGKVMFKNTTPAEGALVVFHPVDPGYEKEIGGKPFAKVQADGKFVVGTYGENDGAPQGEYAVTIDWRGAPKETKSKKLSFGTEGTDEGIGQRSGGSVLNPKYGNPQNPAFKVKVQKGSDNEFTFDVD